ncbi:InlB B-repeat-containing protein [Methylococcus capsulatus]|uniref:InlB B-repeat-containing protein n=1 Tax=Methylococcus capsulatus TaxID=414 RepID=UPI001C52DAAD|nr:DUF3466 family protein [Methylococcus capsulatus]QXP91803.1 DUF3466 family protein [Methylococcus capsulatus]
MKHPIGYIFALGLVVAQLSAAASAGVSYNLNNYDGTGDSGGDGNLPAIWTNPVANDTYAGTLNAMWIADFSTSPETLVLSTADALTRTFTSKGATANTPADYWLAVGAKSWFDESAGNGWGHALDFGLVNLPEDGNLTITVEADGSELVPALSVYKGWDTSKSSSRHAEFKDKEDNPLSGTSGLVYLNSKAASAAGNAVTLTLTGLKAGQYEVFVGGNNGTAGGKYKVTLATSPARYRITDLGTLGTGANSIALGVNNHGEAAGFSNYNANFNANHAFKYASGAMADLGTLIPGGAVQGGTFSLAYSINDAGVVVGSSYLDTGGLKLSTLPVRYNVDGTITQLGTFRTDARDVGGAYDINASGVIVGGASYGDGDSDPSTHYAPFIWKDGVMTSLGSLGGTRGNALAVNDSNDVVGFSFTGGDASTYHAFLYTGGAMRDLHDAFAISLEGATGSMANDINAEGAIVGQVDTANGSHAVLYRQGIVTDLGWLPGGSSASAIGMNNETRIVGVASVSGADGPSHAFLFEDGELYDLNNLLETNPGWELTRAHEISNTGYIVGQGNINGASHAFLLSPIPDQMKLDVAIAGSGKVQSDPVGLDCAQTCAGNFDEGTQVTLSAAPAAGYVFSGWSGACSGNGTTCTVAMDGQKSVTATFTAVQKSLAVAIAGAGSVKSSPAGLNCAGGSCESGFDQNAQVTLSAVPEPGYVFLGWSGGCTGTGACILTMDGDKSVSAKFISSSTPQYKLRVSKPQKGTVTSSPDGIHCGGSGKSCKASFYQGTEVTLIAMPKDGQYLKRWVGCTSSEGAVCRVAVSGKSRLVTAKFAKLPK